MGYACPVCDRPQHDAEHLANHLAVTALTHGDAHEAWLNAELPGWVEERPETLGERAVPHAEEVSHETVFEDTTGGHDHADGHGAVDAPDTEAARAAVEEARRMAAAADDDADDESGTEAS
jgi:hypothetical protein